jgi:hypothetical protein
MALLYNFVQGGATVFSAAPMNNNFQANSTSKAQTGLLMNKKHPKI